MRRSLSLPLYRYFVGIHFHSLSPISHLSQPTLKNRKHTHQRLFSLYTSEYVRFLNSGFSLSQKWSLVWFTQVNWTEILSSFLFSYVLVLDTTTSTTHTHIDILPETKKTKTEATHNNFLAFEESFTSDKWKDFYKNTLWRDIFLYIYIYTSDLRCVVSSIYIHRYIYM